MMTASLGAPDPAAIADGARLDLARAHAVMGAIAGAVGAPDVCRIVAKDAAAALGAERAVIALASDDGASLHLVASDGYAAETMARSATFRIDDSTPMGRAVIRGQPVVVES